MGERQRMSATPPEDALAGESPDERRPAADAPAAASAPGPARESPEGPEDAARRLRAMADREPQNAELLGELAAALRALDRVGEALAAAAAAARLAPEDAALARLHGVLLLANGRYAEGWSALGRVRRLEDASAWAGHYRPRRWDGRRLNGDVLLLDATRSDTDAVQFSRYLPLVAARGAEPAIACSPSAAGLLARLPGVAWLAVAGERRPPYDFHADFDDLPRLLETTPASAPPPAPPVPDPRLRRLWRERLSGAPSPRIAVAWSGPGEALEALAGVAACFTLLEPAPGMTALPGAADALDVAAAALEGFDMVVSDDNALGHLAGALGLPCWMLLDTTPDWRWLHVGRDTPWYPSMRILRRNRREGWGPALTAARREIARRLARAEDRLAASGAALAAGHTRRAAVLLQAEPARADVRFHRQVAELAFAEDRPEDAAQALHRAVVAAPEDAEVHSAFAGALARLGAHVDRERLAARAVALDPDSAARRLDHGDALAALGRDEEALAAWRAAHERAPDDARAAERLASQLLRGGDFAAGLPLLPCGAAPPEALPTDAPIALDGLRDPAETVWLLRYAPRLPAGALVAVAPSLRRLVAGQPGVAGLLTSVRTPPGDAPMAPIGALPRLCGTRFDTIPGETPYLVADDGLARQWRSRLTRPERLRIGVAWGEEGLFEALAPLFALRGAAFFSLDTGPSARLLGALRSRAAVADLSTRLADAAELAGAISALDLIVGPDGLATHIAGALDRPSAVLLTRTAHWRWFSDREDSPWYPSARLFRQRRLDDWSHPIADLAAALEEAIAEAGLVSASD